MSQIPRAEIRLFASQLLMCHSQEELGLPLEAHGGSHANWLALGGDSLGALRCCQLLASRLRQARKVAAASTGAEDNEAASASGGGEVGRAGPQTPIMPPRQRWAAARCYYPCESLLFGVRFLRTPQTFSVHENGQRISGPAEELCVVFVAAFGELLGPLAPAHLLQRPELKHFARYLFESLDVFPTWTSGSQEPGSGSIAGGKAKGQTDPGGVDARSSGRCAMTGLLYDASAAGDG